MTDATEHEDDFLARCRSARLAAGISQHEMARRMTELGIPLWQSSIAKVERVGEPDRRALTLGEAFAMSTILRVPILPGVPDAILDVLLALDTQREKLTDLERALTGQSAP